jgi:transcriptional regulator with XRE-family HTH domain
MEMKDVSEKKKLLEAIRMRLRRDAITYGQLAEKLKVSEVTVKRYFSEERLPLEVVDEICGFLGCGILELLGDLKIEVREQKDTFTAEQERALADDDVLFVLFFMVARGLTFDQILENIQKKNAAVLVKALRELEHLGLVSYPTNEELRPLVSCNARISPGGALWKKYSQAGIEEFYSNQFSHANEYFRLHFGYLSEENVRTLRRKMENLEDEIKSLLALNGGLKRAGDPKKFYWVTQAFRPMPTSVLQLVAEKSNLIEKLRVDKNK